MRLSVAIRAFFRSLFNAEIAQQIDAILESGSAAVPELPPPQPATEKPVVKAPPKPTRSEAITLLATLQREARLVDFFKESLDGYSDAQIGAAVRDIHRDTAAVLDRMFAIEPVVEGEEGRQIEVPAGFDAGCYRLTGNVTGTPPFNGTLAHHGWKAGKCELPAWSGGDESARTVAPAEVELK
ncbi:MAG: DUF2760 domain-containing protein [Planctomycetota bacterium]|nr:DUF2760 domain-containing protein [Planctomycetota bacterium]